MLNELTDLLDFLEKRIDFDRIKEAEKFYIKTLNFENTDRLPVKVAAPSLYSVGGFSIEDIHKDPFKMLYNELLSCVNSILLKDDGIPMVRANYGVGTLPSLFGLKCNIINGNMPWVKHLSKDEADKLLKQGVPDINAGFGRRLTETHGIYKEVLSKYPRLSKGIRIYHPDFQGPFDVAHLILGSDIYMAMYDDAQKVHDLLELVTKTYIKVMNRTMTEIDDNIEGYTYHWGGLYKGNVLLRNDSAVNVSEDMYNEFIKPYDEMICSEVGGGSMHFCGRADHWILNMLNTKGLAGLNQGYMPNVEFGISYLDKFFEEFKLRKIPMVQYTMTQSEYENLDRNKYKTGLTVNVVFDEVEKAKEFMNY